MIVYEDKTWQTNSAKPNEDFITWEEPRKYWVIPDDSELAHKIQKTMLYDFVLDDDGNLTDIEELPIPESWQWSGQIQELKKQAETLDLQAVRPLRAIAAGTATEEDHQFIQENEAKVAEIRQKITELSIAIQSETTGSAATE